MYTNIGGKERSSDPASAKYTLNEGDVPITIDPLTQNLNDNRKGVQLGTLDEELNYERKTKYYNRYQARFKANTEIRSIPQCFHLCVGSVADTMLTPGEKTCMRSCYFGKLNTKDDLSMMAKQYVINNSVDYMHNARF